MYVRLRNPMDNCILAWAYKKYVKHTLAVCPNFGTIFIEP